MSIEADWLRWLDHVELLNLNICLEAESSLGGSLKRWEEREGKSEGGKERESKGWGGIVGGLDGSKPQNWIYGIIDCWIIHCDNDEMTIIVQNYNLWCNFFESGNDDTNDNIWLIIIHEI